MDHSEAFRRKQYAEDHTLGHREFWRGIFAEVRAEEVLAANTQGDSNGNEPRQDD